MQDHLQGAGLQLHAGDLHDASGEKVRRAEPSIVRATSVVRGALARARDGVQNLVRVGVQHDLLPGGSIEVPMCPVIPSLNSEVYRAGLRCEPQASRNFFALLLPSFANSIHATWDPAFCRALYNRSTREPISVPDRRGGEAAHVVQQDPAADLRAGELPHGAGRARVPRDRAGVDGEEAGGGVRPAAHQAVPPGDQPGAAPRGAGRLQGHPQGGLPPQARQPQGRPEAGHAQVVHQAGGRRRGRHLRGAVALQLRGTAGDQILNPMIRMSSLSLTLPYLP